VEESKQVMMQRESLKIWWQRFGYLFIGNSWQQTLARIGAGVYVYLAMLAIDSYRYQIPVQFTWPYAVFVIGFAYVGCGVFIKKELEKEDYEEDELDEEE